MSSRRRMRGGGGRGEKGEKVEEEEVEEERRIRGSNRRKFWKREKREKRRRRMRGQSRARLRTPPLPPTHTPYSCTAAASSSVATFLVSRMSLMLTMTVTTRKSTAPACGRNDTQLFS